MQTSLWAVLNWYHKLKDRSFKLIFETGELAPEQVLAIDHLFQKAVFVLVGENPIEFDEEQIKEAIKDNPKDWKKSQSQRLREVFYRLWEKEWDGEFKGYYQKMMEKVIKFYLDKID